MPFLHAEHALLAPRRASSRTKKSMFLELEGRFAEWRVEWSLKTLDIFCQQVQYSFSQMHTLSLMLVRFFSHRAHRVHGVFWRTVSSPQKASGIQSSQSVTAKGGCKVL